MSAADDILAKTILPTHLDTEGIRASIAAGIRRRSFFSATVAEARLLEGMRRVCAAYAEAEINDAQAREALRGYLDAAGYERGEGGGGMRDLTGLRRQDLILATNRRMARNARRAAGGGPAAMRAYPAWELRRRESREVPREDWRQRWQSAGEATGWEGACKTRMAALKGSPIWQALGDGAGGYTDTLGNPFPPFAFQSGLDWYDLSREEAVECGLDPDGAQGEDPTAALAPGRDEIAAAAESLGPAWEDALRRAAE